MARGLRSSTRGSGSNHLAPKKGKAPKPHQSPGRAAGARATPTAGVKASKMSRGVGNSKALRGGGLKSGMSSPLTRNKC